MNVFQFEVLSRCLGRSFCSQRDLAKESGISLGSVNKTLRELKDAGYLDGEGAATEAGIAALDSYRVQSAVILAAGMGERIAPISFERPKGLLEVRGEVLIERLIRQLREAGVEDIAIVVGYMRESFFYLEDKFGVTLISNPDYANRNNHASLLKARAHLGNSYICSSDQYFPDGLFKPYRYESTCTAMFVEGVTDKRVVEIDRTGKICASRVGSSDDLCMVGPVYLSSDDSQRVLALIERDYDAPWMISALWEQVLMDNLDSFRIAVDRLQPGAIYEFDYFNDLEAFDCDFVKNVDSAILDNICSLFHCERTDVSGVHPLKEGLTNLSFLFDVADETYVYRHPGNGTSAIIRREAEEYSLRVASKLGLDTTFVFEDPKAGWKVSKFVDGCIPFDYDDEVHVQDAMRIARRLHDSHETSPWTFSPYAEACKIVGLLKKDSYPLPVDFPELSACMSELVNLIKREPSKNVLCHNDFYGPNFLVRPDGRMDLIDWEYSAMSDYASDIGNFVAQGPGWGIERTVKLLDCYFGRKPSELEVRHCLAYVGIIGFYWYVWAMYKEAQGNPVGEWLDIWYRAAKTYGRYAIGLYGQHGDVDAFETLTEDEFDRLVAKVEDGLATSDDLALLEPYRAKRAVLFASGFGSRMLPITVNTPKPLVRVKGRRIICSILDALLAVGIEDIVIVRGYLKDEFDVLLKDYPTITFVDNPIYDTTNNISSAVAVGDGYRCAYVFESDLYLKNPAIIKRYQYHSNYLGVPVEQTPDWCFDTSDGIITDLHKGGSCCHHMYGISYWTDEDGAKLPGDLAKAFAEEQYQQRFWDDVPCIIERDNYRLRIRECTFDDIDEIDSFQELCEIDPIYRP